MLKSALAVGALILLALAPVAVADEGFYVTVYNGEDPQDGARVELWRYSDPAMQWVKEAEAYTTGGGHCSFYKGHPIGTCDIPYTSEKRKLMAFYEELISYWSDEYVYDGPEDYFVVNLYLE